MKTRLASNAEQVKAAALAVLPELVQQWLPSGQFRGEEYVALNPSRKDTNLGSFRIDIHTGRWRDHAIGNGDRDVVSLYAYLFAGGDYGSSLKALASDPLVKAAVASGAVAPPAKVAAPLKQNAAKLAQVRRIYDTAAGLSGMPAATYLRSRGLVPTDAWDRLRASVQPNPGRGAHAVLIAPIEDLDGSLVGVHRTYLTTSGAKLEVRDPRRSFGQVRGCAIRLGEAADKLIICEGLEDGLTLYQELGLPVWVAGGASFLGLMALPDEVTSLTIAADNDAAGERAASRAAEAFAVGSRTVRVMRPAPGFKDFNDQLRGIKS